MASPLRIEFAGALCHVTSRENGRENIYLEDDDRTRQDLTPVAARAAQTPAPRVVALSAWRAHRPCADRTGDLQPDPAVCAAGLGGDAVSVDLLPGLPRPAGAARGLFGHRPSALVLPEPHREDQLRLLRLWQRRGGLCPRGRRAHRAVLVPDQARPAQRRCAPLEQ